ncbi:MAG TPA: DUF72 domain-containing protein [Nitrospiraceae bacterium]|jgi:uncharacterized protein YecE (DUF72 family)|nr:DUF72 domain-containing protein [Nitrospiraceae bacterium]
MIRIGTCSWAEKTLIASHEFYPGAVKFYASQFNTIEVDSTYYAIPDIGNALLWSKRTPDDFIFHIKAYGALTGHGIDPSTLPKDIFKVLGKGQQNQKFLVINESHILDALADRFREVLQPLTEAGKLGVLVFQFPQSFQFKPANLDYIVKCKERMKDLPIAVEFRHGSWLIPENRTSTLTILRENGITYIVADEPQYGNLATVPFLPEVTSKTAYFRFHGRNKGNWLKKGIETSLRYDYLYSDEELREFIPSIQGSEDLGNAVYAMFNNCYRSYAAKNASSLKKMLKR